MSAPEHLGRRARAAAPPERAGARAVSGRAAGTCVAGLALLAASACEPETIRDLSRPALVVEVVEGGGFCSSVYAVDSGGAVWSESGCEAMSSGLTREAAEVGDAERAELDALMDQMLELSDDPDCMVVSPSDRLFRFQRTLDGEDEWPVVEQCEPGVPLPGLELVERLEALVRPPVDAG